MLAALSAFIFSISTRTFEELTTVRTFDWAEHRIAGRYPRLQFTSAGAPVMTLSGTSFPGQLHRFSRIADFAIVSLAELSAKKNEPLPLLLGANPALYFGHYVLTSYRTTGSAFVEGGARREQFELTLKMAVPPPTTRLK